MRYAIVVAVFLCLAMSASACKDAEAVDCAMLNSLFNICTSNYENAAKVCPKFCDLCNYTNGNWSDWSNWSDCAITCGSTTQLRTRTCTNPSPSIHGKQCEGPSTSYKTCNRDACPAVDGGWGSWDTWGSCSATCGAGIQHRKRLCDNPPPARCGNHCVGDTVDDRICVLRGCNDGGWGTWSAWGTCSATCGAGNHIRTRDCTNPTPSAYGQPCRGPNVDFESCTTDVCNLAVRLDVSGRLEINIYGRWGTVCDDNFNTSAAQVACRMLGLPFTNAGVFPANGPESMPIWLDDLECSGSEVSLLMCNHQPVGTENCNHSEDVGLICL